MNFPTAVAVSLASLVPLRTTSAFRSATPNAIRFRSVASVSSYCNNNNLHHHFSTSMESSYKTNSLYWNRETCKRTTYDGPIIKEARILALCDPNDVYNEPLYKGPLPEGATLLKVGSSLEEFTDSATIEKHPNVIFVSHPKAREPLVQLLDKFPSIEWVHTRSAGVDFIASDGLFSSSVQLTNAKGMFSSTLAEYCMMACSYFAKDLPRLMQQKNNCNWEQYPVLELRGATLGIVGYGDIGRASAKLAKAYGMTVLGLKRNVANFNDQYCDEIYGMDGLNELMSKSDYILVATPLTEQTRGLISKQVLAKCKASAVIINVGRGPIIDEEALVEALQKRLIKGAGLDVMTVEPLPKDSPLWLLENVLLSPHNMDMTLTFMKESTEFFIKENLPRFVRGKQLLNPVDKTAGY